eukprot:TRINITY_DN2959_c0_g1_i1.p1 TRINITY_DN2959_c0_g1~~TRINITY_DN2959_c0_g1_i1.p1  ORF type:complete len:364 (+),score=5.01 TRINITY_DN2959_c0_g1_i1:326-1417(+)
MNLSALLVSSLEDMHYYRKIGNQTEPHTLVRAIVSKVSHLEPWEAENERLPSEAFAIMFRLFAMRPDQDHIERWLGNPKSAYVPAIALLYLRMCTDAKDLWRWFEPFVFDTTPITISKSGRVSTLGSFAKDLLLRDRHFQQLLPRIPMKTMAEYRSRISPSVSASGNLESAADRRPQRLPSLYKRAGREREQSSERNSRRKSENKRSRSPRSRVVEKGRRDRGRERGRNSDGARSRDRNRSRERARDRDRDRDRDRERYRERDRRDRHSSRHEADHSARDRDSDGTTSSARRHRSSDSGRSPPRKRRRSPSPARQTPPSKKPKVDLKKLQSLYGANDNSDQQPQNPYDNLGAAERMLIGQTRR